MNNFWQKAGQILTGGIFKDVAGIVDQFVTTKEEKAAIHAELIRLQQDAEMKVMQMQYDDTANARAREVALKDTIGTYVMHALAALVFIAYVLQVFILMFHSIPDANRDLLMQTKETTENIVLLICGYYFGSSAGSRSKTQQALEKPVEGTK